MSSDLTLTPATLTVFFPLLFSLPLPQEKENEKSIITSNQQYRRSA